MSLIEKGRFQQILAGFSKLKPILVVGDIGLDKYTFGEVKRISPEAPVPVLEVSKEWMKLGLAANVTDNLQSLGVQSTICGVAGEDKNASLLEDLLEEQGLKTWGVVRSSERMTTFKERVTTNVQQICRVDYETKSEINKDVYNKVMNRLEDFYKEHSMLIIEDYGKGLITEELCKTLINKFKEQGKMVAIDPSRTTPPKYYRGADLLKPNYLESQIIAETLGFRNVKDVNELANILVDKLELSKIVITLGGDGMALMDRSANGKLKIIPTAATEVFDVSGAGDTAISAISAALNAGATLEEAAWIGNCASGVVVGKKGTANVTQKELLAYYDRLAAQIK
ncbi:MAG: bifunctional hydroxymethylpyrimidine kinase/phosphomethylpyrimidine kinase [Bacteriovoracaceae bacterium]|nr:bifunctional hydroxymethylpyrimidine kinase/phosphomethylpyrimidine kinase [Bacteriovoracaceae bacterium]